MPGTTKQSVSIKLKMKAPTRPVVKTATGGSNKHKKYLIEFVLNYFSQVSFLLAGTNVVESITLIS